MGSGTLIEVEGSAGAAARVLDGQPDVGGHGLTLREVFDEHGPYVGRCLRYLGVPERDLDDACQEVFLVVSRRLAELRSRRALKAWVYGICLRVAKSERRRVARLREQVVEDPSSCSTEPPMPMSPYEGEREVALRLLAELDAPKRDVFVLYHVEQMSMREVAEAVDCPLQTAYSRLEAAQRDLARIVQRMRARDER